VDLTPHVAALRMALEDVAGDDAAGQAAADRMATALAPALQLQLLDLLGEIALDVSAQLPDGRLDLQLAGRDPVLVYRGIDPAPPTATDDEGSETSRLTLRMPESLKTAIESAAAAENVSTNAWLVGAARTRLTAAPRRSPNPSTSKRRITGYVQG
jgi:hypothetical protein